MENIKRKIQLVAEMDATVEQNLKFMGYSSNICTALRKEMGLVMAYTSQGESAVRLIDNLKSGQKFYIILQDKDCRIIPKLDIAIDIVYEDEDLAIINKPSGLAVISNHGHYGRSLENALANIWGQNFVYRPINRLDRDTSGLMVVAKNKLCHSLLSPKKIDRRYMALIEGIVLQGGTVNQPIALENENGMKRHVCPNGKPAITNYEVIKNYVNQNYSLIECQLITGRTHQIRVHLSWLGHPICCDKLYNTQPKDIICPNDKILDRQALHSYKLSFIHPISKMPLSFEILPDFLIQ